jgi:2-iminobutanoate/2-iminopropanoate deaminase
MQKQTIQPDGLVVPKAPYSPVVVSGDLVFVSGQVPYDADGNVVGSDIAAQTHQALRNLTACLAAAGCGLEDVVKVTAFLTDLAEFAGYNEVYKEYFKAPFPARSTVQVGLAGFKVEIEAIARKP